jgi:DNA-binding NarL/FixJ family response regulator
MNKIKVLLVDDQMLFVESLSIVLQNCDEDIEVIGIAEDGQKAINMIKKNLPDVALIDVRMPNMNGVECTKIISEQFPSIKVLILTTFDDDEYILEALKYGANGYLIKDLPTTELLAAIRAVYQGGIMISPKVASKLIHMVNEQPACTNDISEEKLHMFNKLSEREKEVLILISQGFDNKSIAKKMYIAEQTVKNYVSNIYSKLDFENRVQVALFAAKANLI